MDTNSCIIRGGTVVCTGTPEEVAHLMLFLAGDGSDFITGQTIGIDGAFI